MKNETELQVLMQARYIPDGSIVAKRTGEKLYTLVRSLTIYSGTPGDRRKIVPDATTVFLMGEANAINQHRDDTVFVWHTTYGDLSRVNFEDAC